MHDDVESGLVSKLLVAHQDEHSKITLLKVEHWRRLEERKIVRQFVTTNANRPMGGDELGDDAKDEARAIDQEIAGKRQDELVKKMELQHSIELQQEQHREVIGCATASEHLDQIVDSQTDEGRPHRRQRASVCAGCSGPIRDKFIFSVIDLLWHQDCVQCSDCSLKLHERCFTYNGKLYCRHDYWHRFGPKCFACHEPINKSELVQRIKGNRVYHLKCFTCSQCNRRLERGEQLHLIDDKQLLCKQDFQQMNLSTSLKHQKQQKTTILQCHNNTNGFAHADATNNSYFTLLSAGQLRDECVSAKTKRSSLTSLDNMQDGGGGNARDDEDELLDEESDQLIAQVDGELHHHHLHHHQEDEDEDELDDEGDSDGGGGGGGGGGGIAGGTGCAENDDDEDEDDHHHHHHNGTAHLAGSTSSLAYCNELSNNMDLENEENRTGGAINPAACGNHSQQTQNKANGNSKSTLPQPVANGATSNAKKRRRRKRASENKRNKESSSLVASAANKQNKGKSILNGGGQSASILASVQGPAATGAPASQVKCFSSSSTSSTSSIVSNRSTSSTTNSQKSASAELAQAGRAAAAVHPHHHHHSHQNQQHHHSQQQTHQLTTHHQQHNDTHHNNSQSTGGGGGGGGGGGHKPTRVRTVLNEKQLQTLRDCYAHNPRPDALMKEQLVDMTGLSPRVIRVWFQNKRCKDKKKSILYKQMQQHEKDGRHLAGLTHIRGVPLVASSPIQYQDEHSSAANVATDSPQQSVQSPSQLTGAVMPPGQQQQESPGLDIRTYQPPWKSLVDYAQQQQQQQQQDQQQQSQNGAGEQQAGVGQQSAPDRLDTTSPRYQQLIGQMHGYGTNNSHPEPLPDQQVLELHQQNAQPQYSPSMMLAHQHHHHHQPAPPTVSAAATAAGPHYPSAPAGLMQPPPPQHLHAHLAQVGQAGATNAPPIGHRMHPFQH